jgi:2'-5' RNA ligase
VRLFIATTFPDEVMRGLNEKIEKVKPRLAHASWVKAGTQHLTFAFLGEQAESVVQRIQIDGTRFEASLRGCGFFPNRRNARVGWIGVEPAEKFIALAARVRAALTGITFDEKEFKPHLTLMRIRDHWPPLAIEMYEKAFGDFQSAPFTVDSVTLYSSVLSPQGAIHTALRRYELA